MVSAISEYCTDSIVLEGKDRVKKLYGKLAAQYYPGTFVYMSAAGVWTAASGSVSFNNAKRNLGLLEFTKRTSSTFGEVDIDTYITDGTQRNCEIIVGPFDGTIKVAAICKAFGGNGLYGQAITVSSGGKAFSLGSNFAAKVSHVKVGFVAEEGYTSGDTVVKMYLGGVG